MSKNKILIQNTIFLIFRVTFIMIVSLYTVRVVLEELGIVGFGTFNVVNSVVLMFGFLSNALLSGTARFITIEVGKKDQRNINEVFSNTLFLHIILSIIIIVLAETIGLWFLNNHMVIPIEMLSSSIYVYQFAIFTFAITIIQVPYYSLIIAHEKMKAFAYIGITEAIMKLLVVYLLAISPADKLIFYSFLVFLVSIFIFLIYVTYCRKSFNDSNIIFKWNKTLIMNIINFGAWSTIGTLSWVLINHGINIMLNILFGPAINAARAISMQINSAVLSLINNMRTAINPHIIKSYSSEQMENMKKVALVSARYTFYFALLIALPLYFEMENILNLWLTETPEWSISMSKLILIALLFNSIDISFSTVFISTGNIKLNQVLSGIVLVSVLPISYLLTKYYTMNPTTVYYVLIFSSIITSVFVKGYLLKKQRIFSYQILIKNFFSPILVVFVSSTALCFSISSLDLSFLVKIVIYILIILIIIILFDLDKNTKNKLTNKIKKVAFEKYTVK